MKILHIIASVNPKGGGPMEGVRQVGMKKIEMDPRHSDVTLLHFEPIVSRSFSEWAMAFVGIEENMRFDIDGVRASKEDLKMKEAGHNLVNVLEKMVNQHQLVLNSK